MIFRQVCLTKGRLIGSEYGANSGIETTFTQFDEEIKLPYDDNSFDLITSSLYLHWVNNLPGVMKEFNRCLNLMARFWGLCLVGKRWRNYGVRHIGARARGKEYRCHISPMTHVGDVGQLLQGAGFAIPTIDTDILKLEYPNAVTGAFAGYGWK